MRRGPGAGGGGPERPGCGRGRDEPTAERGVKKARDDADLLERNVGRNMPGGGGIWLPHRRVWTPGRIRRPGQHQATQRAPAAQAPGQPTNPNY